jgi:hypothetical protein
MTDDVNLNFAKQSPERKITTVIYEMDIPPRSMESRSPHHPRKQNLQCTKE